MKVLVTRAEKAAQRTADRLREAGHDPVLLPLLQYRDTGTALPEGQFDALVFTSTAAIGIFATRMTGDKTLAALTRLPVFCVGEATATAARITGFDKTQAGPGTASELVDFIATHLPTGSSGKNGPPRLLYLAPADRAFDLTAAASERGIGIVETVIYSAELLDPGAATLGQVLDECADGAALLYSRRSAEQLLVLATKHALADRLARLTLIAISENVANTITGAIAGRGPRILVSQKPHEDGLFELLDQLASGGAILQG